MPTKDAKPGDMVKFHRGWYKHWGICIAPNTIIHLAPEDSNNELNSLNSFSTQAKKAIIKKSTISEVVADCEWGADNYLDKRYRPQPVNDIIQYAKQQLNEIMTIDYNVVLNNCERFAIKCRYRVDHIGEQAQTGIMYAAVGGLAVGAAVLGAVVAAAALSSDEQQREDRSKEKKAITY